MGQETPSGSEAAYPSAAGAMSKVRRRGGGAKREGGVGCFAHTHTHIHTHIQRAFPNRKLTELAPSSDSEEETHEVTKDVRAVCYFSRSWRAENLLHVCFLLHDLLLDG